MNSTIKLFVDSFFFSKKLSRKIHLFQLISSTLTRLLNQKQQFCMAMAICWQEKTIHKTRHVKGQYVWAIFLLIVHPPNCFLLQYGSSREAEAWWWNEEDSVTCQLGYIQSRRGRCDQPFFLMFICVDISLNQMHLDDSARNNWISTCNWGCDLV